MKRCRSSRRRSHTWTYCEHSRCKDFLSEWSFDDWSISRFSHETSERAWGHKYITWRCICLLLLTIPFEPWLSIFFFSFDLTKKCLRENVSLLKVLKICEIHLRKTETIVVLFENIHQAWWIYLIVLLDRNDIASWSNTHNIRNRSLHYDLSILVITYSRSVRLGWQDACCSSENFAVLSRDTVARSKSSKDKDSVL